MLETIGVAVAHDDEHVLEAVAAAIEGTAGLFVAATTAGVAGAARVLVAGGAALESLRSQDLPVVALADGEPVRAARAALAVGAADIVRWPGERDRLEAVIRRAASARTIDRAGLVVAVLGARGGAGTSTVARALAATFSDAIMLDLTGRAHNDLATSPPSALLQDLGADPPADALQRALVELAGGVRAALAAPEAHRPVDVVGVLRVARSVARRVVVDAGTAGDARAHAAASASDVRVLVVPNDVASVRSARAMLGSSDATVVLRRARRLGVAKRDVSAALGVPAAAVIPTQETVARAADLGRAPAPHTRVARRLERLARALEAVHG